MQQALEQCVESDRFSMRILYESVWPRLTEHASIARHIPRLEARLGSDLQKLAYAVLRHVFLIELVKVPKIETTKFRVRWFAELRDDPRWCSFDECLLIASDILAELAGDWFSTTANANAVTLSFRHSLLPYEIPLDYRNRPQAGDDTAHIHTRGNLAWTCTDTMLRTLKLRKFLTEASTSPDAAFFKKVLDDKMKIKTYLTDRVLTGDHKTNREKRWEVHPPSVHFATRRDCMKIEYTLIRQLCAFDTFPARSREMLQAEGILPGELSTFRCPVTLEPMSFTAFREELMNPTHGKSQFQVGHLNPLKLDDDDAASGHRAENISWISANGNRIQGSLGLAEIRSLLHRIADNYTDRGWN